MTSQVYVALRVPGNSLRAFEAFTDEIALWWQPSSLFQLTPRGDGRLAFEPGVDGRLLTRFANGEEFEIGRISIWEPGRRLVFTWRPASFTPEQSTEVEVRFEGVGESIASGAKGDLSVDRSAVTGIMPPTRKVPARDLNWNAV